MLRVSEAVKTNGSAKLGNAASRQPRLRRDLHAPSVSQMTSSTDRPRRLNEISIELTSKCNLTCVMCSVWKGRRDGILGARIKELLAEARRLGAEVFTPSGAEVFMRKDAVDILEAASNLGFRKITVVNNGMLIRKNLTRLKKITGLVLPVSIDGPEHVHDALRGKGSYEAAIAGVRASVDAGIPTSLQGVLMRPTIESASHLIELAQRYGLSDVSFQPFQPEIAGPNEDHSEWSFLPRDREIVSEKLESLLDQARLAGVNVYTETLFPDMIPYLFEGRRPIAEGGCYLPARFLLIDGRGETYPCFFMRGQSMGNVAEGVSLSDIWHGPVQRRMQTLGIERKCPGCLASCSDIQSHKAARSVSRSPSRVPAAP